MRACVRVCVCVLAANRCVQTVRTPGENINLTWSPDGQTIAVGNKVRLRRPCCYIVTNSELPTLPMRSVDSYGVGVGRVCACVCVWGGGGARA